MAARVLARMVRACRSPPPQRCARGVYTRSVPVVAIAASERWNAALGAGLASFGAGGFVAAAGIGTAECAGRDDDDETNPQKRRDINLRRAPAWGHGRGEYAPVATLSAARRRRRTSLRAVTMLSLA